ncbi:MAG TPA: Ig-like domain-containing protein [Bryobacteraceae bacterium]|nr:Ig-like domain-containing protein [Bryobacteraceae bacterium]
MRHFLALVLLAQSLSAATTVLFSPGLPDTGPFPTDYLTVPDATQMTGLRLNLPLPSCETQYTECQEIGLLEQVDGFNIRARIRVRFSGPVDPTTLAGGLYFVAAGDISPAEPGVNKIGDKIAVDEVIYDPSSNTAYAKPAVPLDQHSRYVLVVTDAIKDTAGASVMADTAFTGCVRGSDDYCQSLANALSKISAAPNTLVAASLFTTMSATAWLEHARDDLQFVPPQTSLVPNGTFSIAKLAGITLHEQTGSIPTGFTDLSLPITSALLAGLGSVTIGSFQSPNFLNTDQTIAPVASNPSLPIPAATNQVFFNALLPSSPKPAAGYPVIIFGHGLGDSRFGGPTAIAPTMGRSGFAVIAISAVGHGFGPLSTVSFTDSSGNVTTIPAGGRSVDLNGDGTIEADEGCTIVAPIGFGTRDCFRQTVVDLMQLVRAIQQGIDLDGDGKPDLDASHIYYGGQSLGAMYGTILTALMPQVRAAALNVGGGTAMDIARWSPAYKSLDVQTLGMRVPSLLNQGQTYNEDYVFPGQPAHVTTAPGAIAIQNEFEILEWLQMSGDPIAFAPHIQLAPFAGSTPRPTLIQFALGDMTMPNPATTGLIRAGGLANSTWEYRHDLARAKTPDLPSDPHPFLVLFVNLSGGAIQLPGVDGLAISIDAQGQIAGFFTADGQSIPDPNVLSYLLYGVKLFEVPGTLPMTLGF